MRHADRMVFATLASFGCFLSNAASQGEDGPAAQIVAELESIKIPPLDPGARGDQKAIVAYWESLRPLFVRRADLTMDLFRVAPDHPALAYWMNDRWWRNFPSDKSKRDAEIAEVLVRSTNIALRTHAFYWRAVGRCESVRADPNAIDAVPAAIEEFISVAPQDPRGASLLSRYASLLNESPGRQRQVERRLAFEYPETSQGKRMAGKLRQPDSVGKPFDLEFTDAIEGNRLSMKDFRGKVVVVDFWATWCGSCLADMPRLKTIYEKYHDKGVEFIGVSLDFSEKKQGLERMKTFVSKNQIPWPQYYQGNGWESEFSTSCGITSIPALFVIDQDGNVYSTSARDRLETVITDLLASKKSHR